MKKYFVRFQIRKLRKFLVFKSSIDSFSNLLVVRIRTDHYWVHDDHNWTIDVGLKLPFVRADKRNRWNFNRANWAKFRQTIDETILRIPPQIPYRGLITSAARKTIPRGHRESIIHGWSSNLCVSFSCKEVSEALSQVKSLEESKSHRIS